MVGLQKDDVAGEPVETALRPRRTEQTPLRKLGGTGDDWGLCGVRLARLEVLNGEFRLDRETQSCAVARKPQMRHGQAANRNPAGGRRLKGNGDGRSRNPKDFPSVATRTFCKHGKKL